MILFDEIEKAHPEVFNILLQILDNGRLTDGKGKLVNFKNAIIIMTSNVGSQYFKEMSRLGFVSDGNQAEAKEADLKERILESLKRTFKPEFLNRIDETVVFNTLRKKEIEKIVDLQVEMLKERLKERNIKINIDTAAKKYIVDNGFDPEYGARPIRRLIQKAILDKLADKIIGGQIKDGDKVKISFEKSSITVSS